MNRPCVHLLLKTAGLLFLIVLLDRGAGFLLQRFYFSQRSGLQHRTTYALDQTRADVLFFGSSRCNHHYNPSIFEDSLKRTAYNVGRDGNGLPYHYAVLKSILSRYTPKVVVLDLLDDDFEENSHVWERLSSLLPYYNAHPEIRPIVAMRSAYEPFKLLSATYPYNSSLVTIAAGNVTAGVHAEDIKGYLPLTTVWNGPVPIRPARSRPAKIDERKVNLFRAFITACKQRGIKLYVAVSPYLAGSGPKITLPLAREITTQQHVPFWNYAADSTFSRSARLFSDPIHLNQAGATAYSAALVGRLRQSLSGPADYPDGPLLSRH